MSKYEPEYISSSFNHVALVCGGGFVHLLNSVQLNSPTYDAGVINQKACLHSSLSRFITGSMKMGFGVSKNSGSESKRPGWCAPAPKKGGRQTRCWRPQGRVMKRGRDEMRHQCSQQALPALPQPGWRGSLLPFRGCLHSGEPQTIRCVYSQTKVGQPFPTQHALLCSPHRLLSTTGLYLHKMKKNPNCWMMILRVTLK